MQDPVHANASVSFAVAGHGGVPSSGVSAVVLNVTATASATHGYVEPAGGFYAPYATSILNYAPGRTVTNLFLAPVGTDGRASLQSISPGTTALIADVAGYFTAGTPTRQGMFGAIKPTRLVDTRSTHALAANGTLAVPVTGVRGVPGAGVTAVVMNLTAVSPGSHGFLTAYASANALPPTSSVNYLQGQLASNLIIAPVGTDGKVDVHNTSSAATDVLVDVTGYVGPIAGSSWSGRTSVDPPSGGFVSISCPSTRFCAAVDASGHALYFDGTSWSKPQMVSAANDPLTSVSCSSAEFCAATSSVFGFRFDGTNWGDPIALVSLGGDGGDPPAPAGPVSCVMTSFCMARTSPTDVAIFNGSDWVQHANVGSGLSSVSCPTTTFCVLGEPGGVVTYRAGVWSHTTLTGGTANAAETVSCASTTFCVALNSANQAATYDGTTWTADSASGQTTSSVVSLSCVSTTFCVAGDAAGGLTQFDGSTWGPRHGGNPSAAAYVSCASSTFCGAVFGDPAGSVTTYRSGAWGAVTAVNPAASSPQSVSCPTSTFCAAVDSSGAASIMTGTSWSKRKMINDQVFGATASVSCVSSSFCLALFEDRHYSEYNGSTWSAPASAPVSGSVSCTSPTFCVAAGRVSAATFDGTSWSSPTDLDDSGTLSSVSCVSTAFCVASAIDGNVWRYQSGTWSAAHRVADQLDGVSCASVSFCVAVLDGLAYNFNGSTWTATTSAAQGYKFEHVSCASASFCLAADPNGNAQTWNGTAWSGLIALDPGHPIASESCPTASFCALLDFDGAVVRRT